MRYMPKHKYAFELKLRAHAEAIVDKWDLREKTQFGTQVETMT